MSASASTARCTSPPGPTPASAATPRATSTRRRSPAGSTGLSPPGTSPAPGEEVAWKDFAVQELTRQERVVHKWYREALGIGCIGREKEVLEAWQKNGKQKDPQVAEILGRQLNR